MQLNFNLETQTKFIVKTRLWRNIKKNDNSKSIIEMSIKNQLSLEEHIKLSQICIKKIFYMHVPSLI